MTKRQSSGSKAARLVCALLDGPKTRREIMVFMQLDSHCELDRVLLAFREAGLIHIAFWSQPYGQPCATFRWQAVPYTHADAPRPPKRRIPS